MAVSWWGCLLPVSACDLVLSVLLQWWPWIVSVGWASLLGCWLVSLLRLVLLGSLVLSVNVVSGWGGRGQGLQWLLFAVCVSLLVPVYASVRVLLSVTQPLLSLPGSWALPHALSAFAVIAGETLLPVASERLREASSAPRQTSDKDTAKATLSRVLSYSWPDAIPLSGAFIFLTLAVIGEMFGPYYTGRVIDILSTEYNQQDFMTAISYMFLTSIGSSLAAGLRGGLFMLTLARFVKRLRGQLFGSIVHQEIAFFESTKAGDIISRLSTDTTLMSRSVALNINVLLRSLVKTIGILFFMFSLSWKLTLLTLIETPLTAIIQSLYNQYHQRLLREVQDSIAFSGELAAETVAGIRTVRSFAMEEEEFGLYHTRLMDTEKLKNKRDLIRAGYLLCLKHVQLFTQVLMLYHGQHLIQTRSMTSGRFLAFILYQMDLGRYVRTLVHIYSEMTHSVGAAEKVFEFLDRVPTVPTQGTRAPDTLSGHIQFINVSFSYPSRPGVPVLKNVSFELRPGEITALVGASGSGKTTCVCLLERFYQPQAGQILLDGKPIEEYDHHYYHKAVGLVAQEPTLFARSVHDNIAYGLADCPTERVSDAANRANAQTFIDKLEDGYSTEVGEMGGQLSVGQKQRVAIARALFRDPSVLILDEATSSLDVDSQYKIQEAVSRLPDQTVLVIAHQLKTVERADQIVVIENGMVVEVGNHSKLMAAEGSYFRLVHRLFNSENNGQSANKLSSSTPSAPDTDSSPE